MEERRRRRKKKNYYYFLTTPPMKPEDGLAVIENVRSDFRCLILKVDFAEVFEDKGTGTRRGV